MTQDIFPVGTNCIEKVKKYFGIELIQKRDSLLMKIVSYFVVLFSPSMKRKDFLENYVTTVFQKIYYPFPESITFSLLVHELTHVIQYKKWRFFQYLTKIGRARLEGEALCAELEYKMLIGEKINTNTLDKIAEMLYNYGLGNKEVEFVKKMLYQTKENYEKTGKTKSAIAFWMYVIRNGQKGR
ncbi:MAG: hypothetical protein N3A54_02550 [Patescibacteria group bacterium]|nr:hypothetical protein [Patescibacteria group bacterium]